MPWRLARGWLGVIQRWFEALVAVEGQRWMCVSRISGRGIVEGWLGWVGGCAGRGWCWGASEAEEMVGWWLGRISSGWMW
jgi:hypothetical protein